MLDIVLVDDHKLVRDGIRGILERGMSICNPTS